MAKKFPLFKNEISFNDDILKYDALRSNYCELLSDFENSFNQYYKKEVVNVEKLNQASEMFADECSKIISFCVFVIMENHIDYIDQSRFIDMLKDEFPDYNPFWGVEKSVNAITTASERLAKQIHASRAAERSNRSHWEGGGFGLRGALKGAFTAGALNMATSAIRGIGDSITDSRDKSKFERFIKDALQNSEYRIRESFIMATRLNYFQCLIVTYHFLAKQGKMPKLALDIESYEAKINNYIQFGNFSVAYDLLAEAIQLHPYVTNLYKHLYFLVEKMAVNENEKELFKEQVDGLYEYFQPDAFEI